jgi:hypothetical protein
MTTTATTTRRPRKTRKATEPTDTKFTWSADDVTVEPPPEEPVQEPSEEPVSDASSEAVAQPAQEAVPAPEKPSKAKGHTLEVPLSETDVPRHFWPSLGADGGSAIAKAHGVEVQVDNKAESLILTSPKKADLEKAHRAIVKMWTDGLAASKVWKTRPEYKAASVQDRWKALTTYLRSYAHDIASAS